MLVSLGVKRGLYYAAILFSVLFVLHLPFLNELFINNFFSSLRLYFTSFEFNASLYYLVRRIGYIVKGYNIIHTAGKFMALMSLCSILCIAWSFRQKRFTNLPHIMILSFTIHYALSTTVHPWYIAPLIAFAPFTGYRYVLIWSALIPLSYSAYASSPYHENLYLVAVEYIIMFIVLLFELIKRKLI